MVSYSVGIWEQIICLVKVAERKQNIEFITQIYPLVLGFLAHVCGNLAVLASIIFLVKVKEVFLVIIIVDVYFQYNGKNSTNSLNSVRLNSTLQKWSTWLYSPN